MRRTHGKAHPDQARAAAAGAGGIFARLEALRRGSGEGERAGRAVARARTGDRLHQRQPKAVETAEILAAALGVPHEVAADLHEHDRSNVPQMPTREFISSVALFFKRPTELVLGRETAEQARRRMTVAMDRILSANEGRDVAVVTHGTVLALYLAPLLEGDEFDLWRRLGLPSYVVLDAEKMEAIETVERVE